MQLNFSHQNFRVGNSYYAVNNVLKQISKVLENIFKIGVLAIDK